MLRYVKTAVIVAALLLLPLLALRLIPYPELENYRSRSFGFAALDRNGQLLRVFPAEDGLKRDWVSINDIPPGALRVFIRAEDRRFYFHPGVDPTAVAMAALRNKRAGRTVSGASTITMQLSRLIKPRGQGFSGKAGEAFDALRLEARLSKKQILELWINGIPFGSNIEGISAMTRSRFGRNISELDDARAALLAVIPRRPSLYDPAINPEAAVRAALTLSQRCGLGLDTAALEEAAAQAAHGTSEDIKAPFFAPHFTDRAAAIFRSKTGARLLPMRTTLDLELQLYAEKRLTEELSMLVNNRVSNGAILAVDNTSGDVLVYVGSSSWFNDAASGKIDGVQAENQPGSCLKPFLYALALENGFSPNDVLPDIPSIFGSSEAYSPANFNRRFNGPVRFRVALASSLNVPAVYLLERLGVRSFEEFLSDLGFNSVSRAMGTHGTGLALGNAEVSLEELVRAFSVIPRFGRVMDLRFISGEEIQPRNEPVMSHDTAWIIADILSDRGSRFVGFGPAPVLTTEFPSIFKTGTANQFQHIWALGATARFTVGVWMGNFSGQTVVGRTGSSIPARIAADMLRAMEQTFPVKAHNSGEISGPVNAALTEICSLSGMSASSGCAGTLREWILPRNQPSPCNWHRGQGSEPVYPIEYQAWLRERFRSGDITPITWGSNAYIRIPASGSVFYFDPGLPLEAQAVRIETAGFVADALVYTNGILQGCLNQAGVFALPLARGRHRITVEDETGAQASVDIEVR